ncbi:MAG: bifunctional DNA primase/polymerase [Rhodopila sp.]
MNADLDTAPEPHVRVRPKLSEVPALAVNLAKHTGWHVFPCNMPKKLPAISKEKGGRGYLDATNDEAGIRALWRRGCGDLIGVATGEMSGIDVLDIDIKHETAVRWWAAASKKIPPTRTFRTNGGGWHVYFRHAPGVRNNTSKLAHGVDVRGDGGYAVHWFSDGCECLDHAPIAPWPDWLLECVLWEPPRQLSPPSPPPRRGQGGRGSRRDRRRSYGPASDRAIDGVIQKISGAPEGERNALLFWGAMRLREREQQGEISKAEASGLLLGAALAAGLDSDEATRTVASAWRTA